MLKMNIKSKINYLIDSFSDYLLYQKGLSKNSVDSYRSDLIKLSNYLQNEEISKTNIDNFFLDMAEFKYSDSTKKRMYSSIKNLQKTYNGLGISILSTPRGVMSDNEAREANVGGEVLCTIY